MSEAVGAMLWPLLRMLAGLAAGLLLANLLEAMNWSGKLGRFAAPIARRAHLGPGAANAFSLAFVSTYAANALLSELFEKKELSRRELLVANLFNALPSYLTHAPTIFFLTWPVLGEAAITYSLLTFFAAFGRTLFTGLMGIVFLPPARALIIKNEPAAPLWQRLRAGVRLALRRFGKRLPGLLYFTIPCYLLMWLGQKSGFFLLLEEWLAGHLSWCAFIRPQAMSIVALQLVAEMGATLGAAGAALQDGALSSRDLVLALLVGNLLATPMRAIRHQLPAYAGLFKAGLALRLVIANQALRALSVLAIILFYCLLVPA